MSPVKTYCDVLVIDVVIGACALAGKSILDGGDCRSHTRESHKYSIIMEPDLVSIITPTYNCSRFISKTIESVLSQTYPLWEMLIIDDCSTDDTEKKILPYIESDSRIKYYRLEHNSGAAVARNTALRLAGGRWIAFLDSDDLWHPEKLERQIRFMRDKGYAFSCTQMELIDEFDNIEGTYVKGPGHVNRFGMLCYCWPACLTVMYDATVVGEIQIADIKKNNDYAMWLKVIEKADCYLLRESLAYYRIRRGSISHDINKLGLIKWHYRLFLDAQGYGVLQSSFFTLCNIVCGVYKKFIYVDRNK